MERLGGRGQATRWRKKKSRVQVDAVVRHPLDSEGKSASVVVRMPQPGVAGMERLGRGQAIRWRKKNSSQVDAVVHHPLDSEDASASTNVEENVNGALAHGVITLTLKEEATKKKDESNHVSKSKVKSSEKLQFEFLLDFFLSNLERVLICLGFGIRWMRRSKDRRRRERGRKWRWLCKSRYNLPGM